MIRHFNCGIGADIGFVALDEHKACQVLGSSPNLTSSAVDVRTSPRRIEVGGRWLVGQDKADSSAGTQVAGPVKYDNLARVHD